LIPVVVLIEPEDEYVASHNVTFRVNATDADNNVKNVSLYGSWNNSVWKSVDVDTTLGNGTRTFSEVEIENGTWVWNAMACDVDGNCVFAEQNYTIQLNSAPTVGTISCTPTELSYISQPNPADNYAEVNCTLDVEDLEGCNSLSTLVGRIWHSSVTENSADSGLDHYTNDSCSKTCSGETGTVKCMFHPRYYAEAGLWSVSINVTDNMDETAKAAEADAFAIPAYYSSINMSFSTELGGVFQRIGGGSFAPGEYSDYLNMSITGYINRPINVKVHGTNIECNYGGALTYADVSYIRYEKDTLDYSNMCAMPTNADSTCSSLKDNFNLRNATDSGPNSKSIYYMLQVPTGVKGSCSTTVYITPVQR